MGYSYFFVQSDNAENNYCSELLDMSLKSITACWESGDLARCGFTSSEVSKPSSHLFFFFKKEFFYSVSFTILVAALYFWALTYLISPWIIHSFVLRPHMFLCISICDLHMFVTGTSVFLIQATAWQLYDLFNVEKYPKFHVCFLSLTDQFF